MNGAQAFYAISKNPKLEMAWSGFTRGATYREIMDGGVTVNSSHLRQYDFQVRVRASSLEEIVNKITGMHQSGDWSTGDLRVYLSRAILKGVQA